MYDVESSHSQMYMCFIQKCLFISQNPVQHSPYPRIFSSHCWLSWHPHPSSWNPPTQIMKPVPSVSLRPLHCSVNGILTHLFFFIHWRLWLGTICIHGYNSNIEPNVWWTISSEFVNEWVGCNTDHSDSFLSLNLKLNRTLWGPLGYKNLHVYAMSYL